MLRKQDLLGALEVMKGVLITALLIAEGHLLCISNNFNSRFEVLFEIMKQKKSLRRCKTADGA